MFLAFTLYKQTIRWAVLKSTKSCKRNEITSLHATEIWRCESVSFCTISKSKKRCLERLMKDSFQYSLVNGLLCVTVSRMPTNLRVWLNLQTSPTSDEKHWAPSVVFTCLCLRACVWSFDTLSQVLRNVLKNPLSFSLKMSCCLFSFSSLTCVNSIWDPPLGWMLLVLHVWFGLSTQERKWPNGHMHMQQPVSSFSQHKKWKRKRTLRWRDRTAEDPARLQRQHGLLNTVSRHHQCANNLFPPLRPERFESVKRKSPLWKRILSAFTSTLPVKPESRGPLRKRTSLKTGKTYRRLGRPSGKLPRKILSTALGWSAALGVPDLMYRLRLIQYNYIAISMLTFDFID